MSDRNKQVRHKKASTFEEINPGAITSEKERLKYLNAWVETSEKSYRNAQKKYSDIVQAKNVAIKQLNLHTKALTQITLDRVPEWAMEKVRLSETISAYDVLLVPALEMLERAEKTNKQAKANLEKSGMSGNVS